MEVIEMRALYDRYTYVCLSCRFTSKYSGQCVLLGMYDLDTPKKHDDRGWKKLEIWVAAHNSNLLLCTRNCCVPISRPRSKTKDLTLSQLKARIRKQRTHRQDGVPQFHGM